MHPVLGLVGAALVLVALVDMLWTTVAVSAGAGPLTSSVSHRLWTGFCAAARRSDHAHRLLRLAGVTVVIAVFTVWIGLFVLGWWLIFSSSPGAVREATTGDTVGWAARLYYVGFTTSTLGVGDLVAGDGLWRLLTVVAAFSGLSVVTMSITYLLPVASAVVDRRSLGMEIASLGDHPADIVIAAWQGGDWHALERRLEAVSREIGTLGQRHLAYPVLHYFHDLEPKAAAAPSIATLDEAMTLVRFGLAPEARPHPMVLDSTRTSVASFLSTLSSGHIEPATTAPPLPLLQPLRDAGIPTVADEEFGAACADLRHRRQLLLGFVHDDGWDWDVVVAAERHQDDAEEAEDTVTPDEVEEGGPGEDAA
ncbi:MAG: potassium channel family protein [Actinobacteria bacterium]|nr:potassium channel family protein [Actinomycetota bacterium]